MITVTESVSIDRPIGEVFAYVADARNRPEWDSSVISEELTSPEPIGVGSTIHTRMKVVGRIVEFDWRIERFESPSGMTVTSTAGQMQTTLHFELAPTATGCIVRASIEATPEGLMRLVEPMIAEAIRSNLATGLGRAKAILEGRPPV